MARMTPHRLAPDNRDETPSGQNAPPAGAAARIPLDSSPHSPRVKAALCYTIPLVPALYLLARERYNRFLRVHAAQSLVFHALVGLAQLVLFSAVVVLGGAIQSMTGALVAAAALFALFAGLMLVVAVTWAHLLADCIRGQVALLPLVGAWALWVEAFTAREVWARPRGTAPRQSASPPPAPQGDASGRPPPAG
jgi:uncharacterized membrane protein